MSDTAVPSPGSLCGQFCAEIKHIQEFLVAQQRVTDITELRSAQCQAISNRIRSLRVMGLQDGTAITSLLETGPWTPQQKQDMAAVVQDRLTAGSSECISGAKTRRRQQVCLSLEHYFTDRDLDIIRDQSTSKCFVILTMSVYSFIQMSFILHPRSSIQLFDHMCFIILDESFFICTYEIS